MPLPESTASTDSPPPPATGSWSERRFALTMLGIVICVTAVVVVGADLWGKALVLDQPISYLQLATLTAIEAYESCFTILSCIYFVWGNANLVIRTLLILGTTVAAAWMKNGIGSFGSDAMFPIFIVHVYMLAVPTLMILGILRLAGLSQVSPTYAPYSQRTNSSLERWQIRIVDLLYVTLSLSLVFAFLRYQTIIVIPELMICAKAFVTAFFAIASPLMVVVILLIPRRPIHYLPLIIVAPLLVVSLQWLSIKANLGLYFYHPTIATETLSSIIAFAFLLPVHIAGYRIAWHPFWRSKPLTLKATQ